MNSLSPATRPQARPGILDIAPYVPGKSGAAGIEVHKLSSNESPLGASPKAKAAYAARADSLEFYPDGSATVLREAMFVPWQAPGRREPARVTAGAFTAAGLPVPEHPAQRNIYQLTRRQGLAWTPGLDAHIRSRGGELLGHGHLILVDIDSPAAADGRPLVNALHWLADRAVEAGALLDLSATVAVRTPGHPASGHLPGWHLWYRADPGHPVHLGPLARCHAIELRTRGTCPGSPRARSRPRACRCPSTRRSGTSTSSPGGRAWRGRPAWMLTSAAAAANCSATDT